MAELTPLERAIRAGCTATGPDIITCGYPGCDCGMSRNLKAALAAALADDEATIKTVCRIARLNRQQVITALAALARHILGEVANA